MPAKHNDAAISDLTLNISLLVRKLRSSAPPEMRELSWTQKAVVVRLERDGPATSAELARLEGVKPQSMGAVIQSLEDLGLVERKPHPTDGRQLLAKITAKGAAIRKHSKDARQVWLSEAITKLSKHDQETLFAASDILKKLAAL